MAKSKKRKKKNQKANRGLSSREQKKFYNLLALPVAIMTISLLLAERVGYFCAKLFTTGNDYFYKIKYFPFLVLAYAFGFILLICLSEYLTKAQELNLTRKEYFKLKNIKAKKQTKDVILKSVILIALSCVTFLLGSQQKYIAQNNSIVSYNLFKADQTYIDYSDVTSVKVEKIREHIYKHGFHDEILVTLKTKDKEMQIHEDEFKDYSKIKDFLKVFDEDVVQYSSDGLELLNK